MNTDESKKAIQGLLDKYSNIVENKKITRYNEEMTKKDFILPLFRALGWDVENSNEVSAEEKISKGRVDYGFRINGIPKFFLEAKPLRENLDNPKFVEQAINYAWFKGCTWAVLTNFERVRIFNAEWKTTNLAQSHLKTISCDEFLIRFNELWLLSKESFEQGLLDKEAERWGKKTRRTPVDKQLLADFTRFRELLSKNITRLNQNKNLTEEELDESVQRILDRLVFIRNCEDRELEPPLLKPMVNVWEKKGQGLLAKGLRQIFSYYDKNYNSKIFADHLCDHLEIDDDVVREIIDGLYFTQDRSASYDFSAIEADVLGNIYEQYLGHILKKTATRAKLTESHAHRKEQGIYYTPTYIVDYIVQNTLGELLKDKNVDVENIRILDPACGSGSFLIKAFDLLDEYHKKHSKGYSQQQIDMEGETDLPYNTKIKILEKNIFGVDLDKQAVEIAQLNLLLKIAERGQRLPLLNNNIKCGNSLIDDPAVAGDKAFKWEKEFPEVMNEGGFDIIIGNPPYGAEVESTEKSFLKRKYPELKSGDSAEIFIKRAIDLLKADGILGFIVPKTIAFYESWKGIRNLLLNKCTLMSIADVGIGFPDVNLEQIVIIVRKRPPQEKKCLITINQFSSLKRFQISKHILKSSKVNVTTMLENNILLFVPMLNEEQRVINKINEKSVKIANILSEVFRGLYISDTNKLKLKKGDICFVEKVPWLRRYLIEKCIKIDVNVFFIDQKKVKKIMRERLLFKVMRGKRLVVHYDEGNLLTTEKIVNVIIKKDAPFPYKFLLGFLNSKLISFYLEKAIFSDTTETSRVMDYPYVSLIPIPVLVSEPEKRHIINLVDKMLALNKRLNEIGDKKTDERAKIEEEIKKTDAEIDRLVYKIYDLTDEEIKIVEEYAGG